MLVAQQAQGIILCLCSKNHQTDVRAVFAARPDMPLSFEHILSHRINWSCKSANLISLAEELQLDLDAFMFIDDNPLECAEVRDRCPEVLTLQIPTDPDAVHAFLHHTWAFDLSTVSAEAAKRTMYYRQNRQREAVLSAAPDFASFLAELQLDVNVSPLRGGQLGRAAELLARTNQFNLTTIRRTAGEISVLMRESPFHLMTVSVSDRFGEYGLTGLVFMIVDGSTAEVDTFILSCRVLGRGVEAAVVNQLGSWAAGRGLSHIQFEYKPTVRNAPAALFLKSAFAEFEVRTSVDSLYKVPVVHAMALTSSRCGDIRNIIDRSPATAEKASVPSHRWYATTSLPTRVSDIVTQMLAHRAPATQLEASLAHSDAPRGPVELSLAQLWAEVLGHAPTKRHASFIESGGNSVAAVSLTAKIARSMGVRPSLAAVTRCHSLAAMAELITALRPDPAVEEPQEVEEGSI
jgi:FkbH-like protein